MKPASELGEALRARFASEPVARLATNGPSGPHLVPIVFALADDAIVTAVDHKPKKTRRLQRLYNIERDPQVAVLTDHYEPDWSRLWWIRADGIAEILDTGLRFEAALDRLVAKYPQYRSNRPTGPVVHIRVRKWSAWEGDR